MKSIGMFLLLGTLTFLPTSVFADGAQSTVCAKATPTDNCLVNMQSGKCLGTDGDDVIIANQGKAVIIAGAGNDRIIGSDEDDTICGGPGDDTIFGNNGDDFLDGGEGSNIIAGDTGTDVCLQAAVASNCEDTKGSTVPTNNCDKYVGKWQWFDNGTAVFSNDNKVVWLNPLTQQPGHSANWYCDPKSSTITIPWTNGFTDVMKFSNGLQNLQGKNNRGMTIWAQRWRE